MFAGIKNQKVFISSSVAEPDVKYYKFVLLQIMNGWQKNALNYLLMP